MSDDFIRLKLPLYFQTLGGDNRHFGAVIFLPDKKLSVGKNAFR